MDQPNFREVSPSLAGRLGGSGGKHPIRKSPASSCAPEAGRCPTASRGGEARGATKRDAGGPERQLCAHPNQRPAHSTEGPAILCKHVSRGTRGSLRDGNEVTWRPRQKLWLLNRASSSNRPHCSRVRQPVRDDDRSQVERSRAKFEGPAGSGANFASAHRNPTDDSALL